MAEPKKPAGATQQAGPEEPTRYLEQQPMGVEGEEGDGGKSFDYIVPEPEPEAGDEVGGEAFDYIPPEPEPEVGTEVGGQSFDYVNPPA
jgi:hypothetical protein